VRNISLGREREHIELHCWRGSWRELPRGRGEELIHLSYLHESLGLAVFLKTRLTAVRNISLGREREQLKTWPALPGFPCRAFIDRRDRGSRGGDDDRRQDAFDFDHSVGVFTVPFLGTLVAEEGDGTL